MSASLEHRNSKSKSGRRTANDQMAINAAVDVSKSKLHHLFGQIEKEFDLLVAENVAMKERIDALEELIVSSGTTPNESTNKVLQQKLSVGSMKKDSMPTAAQLSAKIKSTYKLKASGRIFKTQSNFNSHLVAKFEWHKDGVWYVNAVAKHGKQLLATASADGTASVCDMTKVDGSCSPMFTYTGHQGCSVNCVRFHPTHDLVLTAAGDGTSHVWKTGFDQKSSDDEAVDLPDDHQTTIKTPLCELTGHSSVVVSCDWISGVDQCVTASWDRMANIYDIHTGELVIQLAGHDSELTDVCAHGSTRLIVTSSHDTTFRLWDFRDAIHSVSVFQGHTESVMSASFLGNDKVISGADDRNVKIWDLRNMRSPLTTICVEAPINKLAVSQQHNVIAIPLDNRHVRIFDTNGNRVCRLPRNHHDRMVTCAAWSSTSASNNLQLFTSAFDRRVCAWSIVPGDKS